MNAETWIYPRWYRLAVVPFVMTIGLLGVTFLLSQPKPAMIVYCSVLALGYVCGIVDAFGARVTIDDVRLTVRRFPMGERSIRLDDIQAIKTSRTVDSAPIRIESANRTLRITWPLVRRRQMAEALLERLGERVEFVNTDGVDLR